VYVVGLQRSGTNMVLRGLERLPEFEVHNENDRRAFHRFHLRQDAAVAAIVAASRHRFVLFKPLCDSHRVDQLLDGLGAGAPGRAVWVYREVDGRARSAVAKFGDANRRVLAQIARGEAGDRWQAQRLSVASLELIARFDYHAMSPESAAALFWFVRNSLYFDLGLHARDDVFLSSYDSCVADPQGATKELCRFLGVRWDPALTEAIGPRSTPHQHRLEIDPEIRRYCDDLQSRLDAARTRPAAE